MRTGRPREPLAQRFWSKVDENGPVVRADLGQCWLWRGAGAKDRYGSIGLGGAGRMGLAHRVSWELHNGPIPGGMFVCHKCDVGLCVNPDHLFLGTAADNMLDKKDKGRCRGNWKLTPDAVRQVRQEWDEWSQYGLRQYELADIWNVSTAQIAKILSGDCWPHV